MVRNFGSHCKVFQFLCDILQLCERVTKTNMTMFIKISLYVVIKFLLVSSFMRVRKRVYNSCVIGSHFSDLILLLSDYFPT